MRSSPISSRDELHPSGATYASWLRRAGGDVIDWLVVLVPTIPLYYLIDSYRLRFLISVVMVVAYNGLLDGGESGQTLGKRMVGIRVIDAATGRALGAVRGLGRAGITIVITYPVIPVVALMLTLVDVLLPLWDPRRQSIHDKACGSVVVDVARGSAFS